MLKIKIVAVGKVKEKYFSEGIAEYLKRISRFAEISVAEVKEENFSKEGEAERKLAMKREADRIFPELKGVVVCLAVEGKKLSSEKFSEKIGEWKQSASEICFVIGGSYGLNETVKKRADYLLSFSDMTFPHTLMRLILTEQLYRALSISAGTGYHK